MKRAKKHLAAVALSLVMMVGLLPISAVAAFSDVPSNAWYANDVASVQQYGIINGTGNGKFSPNGKLTLAQAITMAARTHAHIYCEEIPVSTGSAWYAPYLRYADDNGICAMGEFGANYNGECSRIVMAKLFERVVPESTAVVLNRISVLPDVAADESNLPIYRLYELGILTGSDKYGTFHPEKSITRAETAAILHRVLEPSARKSFVLAELPSLDDLYQEAIDQVAYEFYYSDDMTAAYIASGLFDGGEMVYFFHDMDGNGVDEILFEFSNWPGQIYAMYTVQSYQSVCLGMGFITDRYDQYYNVFMDGRITRWSSGVGYDALDFYQLPKSGTALNVTDSLVYEYDWYGGSEYWYSNTRSFDKYDFDTHAGYSRCSETFANTLYKSAQ